MNNYLFLDFDGVLNCQETKNHYTWHLGIETRFVEQLNRIVQHANCDIIVSSTWRKNYTPTKIGEILEEHGFLYKHRVIGQTQVMHTSRGIEIDEWMQRHTTPPCKFVILDDDPDMNPRFSHLIQTTWERGLLPSIADDVIDAFRSDDPSFIYDGSPGKWLPI